MKYFTLFLQIVLVLFIFVEFIECDLLYSDRPLSIPNNRKYPYRNVQFDVRDEPTGTYHFGYDTSDDWARSFREEKRDAYGRVWGKYGYVDPNGVQRIVEYYADENGYRARTKNQFYFDSNPEDLQIIGPIPKRPSRPKPPTSNRRRPSKVPSSSSSSASSFSSSSFPRLSSSSISALAPPSSSSENLSPPSNTYLYPSSSSSSPTIRRRPSETTIRAAEPTKRPTATNLHSRGYGMRYPTTKRPNYDDDVNYDQRPFLDDAITRFYNYRESDEYL